MKTSEILQIAVIGLVLAGGTAVIASKIMGPGEKEVSVAVTVPKLTKSAIKGRRFRIISAIGRREVSW